MLEHLRIIHKETVNSNAGKIFERLCVRPGSAFSLQEARELVERYIQHYNEKRLHSPIGYVTPMDKLERS